MSKKTTSKITYLEARLAKRIAKLLFTDISGVTYERIEQVERFSRNDRGWCIEAAQTEIARLLATARKRRKPASLSPSTPASSRTEGGR